MITNINAITRFSYEATRLAIVLSFLLSGGTFTLHAQSSLDTLLSQYIRPDFTRSQLDFRPNVNGSARTDNRPDMELVATLSTMLSTSYSRVENTRGSQLSESIVMLANGSVRKVGTSFAGLSVDYQGSRRIFYKPKRYVALHNELDAGFTAVSNATDNYAIQSVNDIGFGFGRVELVSDAVHTARIIDMLASEGVLLQEVSESDLLRLADTIATMKNRRFFDSRLQRIREVEAITRMLAEGGYIEAGDYYTFAILSDAYDFEQVARPFRSGSTVEFLLGRDFNYSSNSGWKSADDLRATINWQRYQVRSRYVSTAYSLSNRLSYRRAREDFYQDRYTNSIVGMYTLYYAPTNRVVWTTSALSSFLLDVRKRNNSSSVINDLSIRVSSSVSYYLSPEVRLFASAVVQGSSKKDDADQPSNQFSRISLSFELGMLYSYF